MNSRRGSWLAAALIIAAALAAYANTFGGPLVFDDVPAILENPSIAQLWPPWGALSPPHGFGQTVSGRPLLNLSLAINYAISGPNPWSYHVFNLLIHALAGLTLFALARRTLRRPVMMEMLGDSARPAALVLALLWTLHPLQTEAVTYIVQRAESLMALFYLLTLYGFVRAVESPRPWIWQACSIMACAAGMGCKEVMVTAPVIVMLFDRTFVAGSFRAAWRSRRWFYAGLAATWLPLSWLVVFVGGDRGGTFNFTPAAMVGYWLAQIEAVACYVNLALWPAPLAFDYGWFKIESVGQVAPAALLLVGLAGATLWALWRRPVAGFLGACFFLVLSPTSLMPGTLQIIVEHRMYLPLAAVLAFAVGGTIAWLGRRGVVALFALAAGAGLLTARRNADYQSDLSLWHDTVVKRPGSAIAQSSLGTAYFQRARYAESLTCYEASLRLDGSVAKTHFNAGLALEALGRPGEAIPCYTEAIRLLPYFAQAHAQLGAALISVGRAPEAIAPLRTALGYLPKMAEAQNSLGLAFTEMGQPAKAIACYEAALRVRPDFAEAECNWGAAALRLGQLSEAAEHLARALQLKPGLADAHYNLGLLAAARGNDGEAQAHYADAVRLDASHVDARLNLGIAFARAEKFDEALPQLREAVRLRPTMAEAHANLGIVLAETGRLDEAIGSYATALRLRPDYAPAHYNLGNAFVRQQRWAEARAEFAEAVRLAPGFVAAREMLGRLNTGSLLP